MKTKLILLIISLFSINYIFAQNNDSLNIDFTKNEDNFKNISKKDLDFEKNLKYGWTDITINKAIQIISEPEKIKKKILKKNISKKEYSDLQYTVYNSEYQPEIVAKIPVEIIINDSVDFETSVEKIEFYGTNLIFEIDKNIKNQNIKESNQNNLSNYWDFMTKTNYNNFLLQLLDFKKILNLPDWGYYMLISKIAQKFYPDNQNNENLFVWFFMSKSGYNTRLLFDNQNISLLIASSNTIYDLPFYEYEGIRYYSISQNIISNPKTYYGNYLDAKNLVSLNINSPINFTEKIDENNFKFTYNDSTYKLTLKYNKNIIDFYKDYPATDFEVYFNSAISKTSKNSFINSFNKLLVDKSEKEKVDFILNFVQNSITYQTDLKQFEKEKYFFPEEILAYPNADCEDKAIFFSQLVKEIVNLDVIGLILDSHISTAVKFNETVNGDAIDYNSEKYYVCDPTFINSPIGYCYDKLISKTTQIIIQQNYSKKSKLINSIWETLNEIGIYSYDKNNSIAFDEQQNYYITGYFSNTINIDKKEYQSYGVKNDIVIAKFSKDNKLEWFNKLGNTGNDYGLNIQIDKQNIYLTGMYSLGFDISKKKLTQTNGSEVFLAKYNFDGINEWITELNVDTVQFPQGFAFYSVLDINGVLYSTNIFNEVESIDNYGITIINDICSVVGFIPRFNYENELNLFGMEVRSVIDKNYFPNGWEDEKNKFLELNYEQNIAVMSAFFKAFTGDVNIIMGTKITELINYANPSLKKSLPMLYLGISEINQIKNSGGILEIYTLNGKTITLDDFIIENKAKLSISTLKGGNSEINIISGIKFTNENSNVKLNKVKLNRITGDLIIDYDIDNSIKTINIDNDLLKK